MTLGAQTCSDSAKRTAQARQAMLLQMHDYSPEAKAYWWTIALLGLVVLSIALATIDRKSTRLNSSHLVISYAVFCLKKKNKWCALPDACHRQSLSSSQRRRFWSSSSWGLFSKCYLLIITFAAHVIRSNAS